MPQYITKNILESEICRIINKNTEWKEAKLRIYELIKQFQYNGFELSLIKSWINKLIPKQSDKITKFKKKPKEMIKELCN